MARYQAPNPLDRVFLATDAAWRLCGLPGVDIHLHLELAGHVDADGLRTALRALHRLYPATRARLTSGGWWAAPRWRIDDAPEHPVAVIETDATDAESMLAQRVDWAASPPLRIAVLRNAGPSDRVVVRWPHAFMDARGAATIVEELARLYEELAALPAGQQEAHFNSLTSADDERRTDFGSLTSGSQPGDSQSNADLARCPPDWKPVRLCGPRDPSKAERIHLMVRRFSPAESASVREAALRVCGLARQADFIRACAIRALHAVAPGPLPPGACYSTLQLVDNRRRRDPGPVCHNIFTSLPVFIPAAMAEDRRAVADRFRDAALAMLETGWMHRRLAQLRRLGRVPMWLLARAMAVSLRSSRSWLPTGLANAPSLPLGFMGDFSRPMKRFCGAELINVFGVRPPAVQSGIGVNVNAALDRMNVVVTYFEPRVSAATVERFIDEFAASLLDPTV